MVTEEEGDGVALRVLLPSTFKLFNGIDNAFGKDTLCVPLTVASLGEEAAIIA